MLSPDVNRYHVEWAISAKVAKEMAAQTEYDVYLVDYNLGASNGLDLVREMIAMNINAPLILMTAYTEYNFDQKVIEAGASDYIDKTDLKPSILKRTIRYSLQRKQDLKALRASEESYRTLMADASDGIILMNPEGLILVANAKAGELLNRPLESLTNQMAAGVLQLRQPEQINYNSFGLDETRLFEHVIHHNGDERFVEISAKQITGQRLQILMRDITHRKRIEAERERYIERLTILQQIDDELTQLLDVNHVLSIAIDATTRLSIATAGFIGTLDGDQIRIGHLIGRYQHLRRGDYLPDMPLINQVIKDQQARFIEDVSTTPDYVATIEDTRSQFIIPLNSYKRVLGVLVLETHKPERFTYETFDFIRLIASRVAVAIENAQLYQLAQEQLTKLTKLYEQVSELEKLKTDMIRIAAHDLRNPVGVVTGYVELLEWSFEEGALTKKQRDHISAIMRAAQRMQKITSDILSLERIEKLHLEKANRIELNDLVQQAYNDFAPQAKRNINRSNLKLVSVC
jgi:PAS domain S-box-containing protein